jgi:hypothetical protein
MASSTKTTTHEATLPTVIAIDAGQHFLDGRH